MKSNWHAIFCGQADDIADLTARHFTFLDMLDLVQSHMVQVILTSHCHRQFCNVQYLKGPRATSLDMRIKGKTLLSSGLQVCLSG